MGRIGLGPGERTERFVAVEMALWVHATSIGFLFELPVASGKG